MTELEIKLNCYKYKEEYKFKLKSVKTTIRQVKEELRNIIRVDLDNIKFLFSSQNLEDDKTLEDYNIQNGNTIFYYYKKPKAQKTKNKIPDKKPEINDNNINNNLNNDDNISLDNLNKKDKETNENSQLEEIGEEVDKYNLKIYSSIIKILTFKHLEKMEQILKNLKEKNYTDFQNIYKNKIKFTEYLKTPITKDDVKNYRQYYVKAKNLLDEQGPNGKFEILITDEEEEYIKSWKKKGLEETTIILEYVKNKFDKIKTDGNLRDKLSEKFN